MGSTLSTQSVQLESCLHDLPGITYEASLGKSRFLKTLRCIHDEGTVLVKVYIKPSSGGTLEKYAEKLKEIRNAVSIFHHPNILPFQIFMETEKAGFMIRQYFYNNLHDRISTRPFLTPIEKKWITFQLLSAVERLHFYGQCHGDIKLENFLLTSWNWVYLSDFACCKPTYIPEDNPVDFSYFFDSSGRRVCYIAPERFIASGKKPNADQPELDPLMDVFSVGCAIAEFWLDGVPVFNYSEAVSFRKKEYDPSQKINRIEDLNVRNLVMSMIQYDRDQRAICSQVIKDWTGKLFPEYFEYLHEYISMLMDLDPDDIVMKIYHDFDILLEKFNPSLAARQKRAQIRKSDLFKSARMEDEASDDERSSSEGKNPAFTLLVETQKFKHDLEIETKEGDLADDTNPEEEIELEPPQIIADNMGIPSSTELQRAIKFHKKRLLAARKAGIKEMPAIRNYAKEYLQANDLTTTYFAGELSCTENSLNDFLNGVVDSNQAARRVVAWLLKRSNLDSEVRQSLQLLYKQLDEVGVQIQSYESMGIAFHGLGYLDKAYKCFERAFKLAKEHDDKSSQAKLLCFVGEVLIEQKDTERAIRYFQKSEARAQELGDKETQALALENLENAFKNLGDIERAIRYQKESAELLKELGEFSGIKKRQELRRQQLLRRTEQLIQSEDVHADGFVIILDLLCSMLRSVRSRQSRLICVSAIEKLANYVDDEVRLQRLVPYLVSLLTPGDPSALVKAQTIKTLTRILSLIKTFPASDAHIFPEYLIPALSRYVSEEPDDLVKQAYAESLPKLAYTARRFLETSQLLKQRQLKDSAAIESKELAQSNFQKELDEIINTFKEFVEVMLSSDSPKVVKKALLSDISTLCMFFGQEKTTDILLPLITSCLDARDWELKGIFFENIVGVSTVAGAGAIESFILPSLLLPEIYDGEEFVVEKALNCLASLCDLGIFRKSKLLEICKTTAPLLLHPNTWIRFGAVALMSSIGNKLSLADVHCFLIPSLRPFMVRDIVDVSKTGLLESLKSPVGRKSFEKALMTSYSDINAFVNESDMFAVEQQGNLLTVKKPDTGEIFKSMEITRVNIGKQRQEEAESERTKITDIAFSLRIAELDVPLEDEEKLFLMKEYVKLASKNYRRHRSEDSNINKDITEFIKENVIIHSVSINKKESGDHDPQTDDRPQAGRPRSTSTLENDKLLERKNTLKMISKRKLIASDSPMSGQIPPTTPVIAQPAAVTPSVAAVLLPPPPPDLGTLIARPIPMNGSTFKGWRPQGVLVAHLHEHKGPVNSLATSADNMFFVSGSDDGNVKIWDCQRLEKNVANKSRLTYTAQGGKIKTVCVCENSHSVASGSSNSSIHVFRIESALKKDKTNNSIYEYKSTSTVKTIDKSEGGVVKVDHFDTESQSVLVYVTDKGKIHGWDLRSKTEAWTMENKPHLGLVTDMLVDPQKFWVVVGTNRGILTQWDIRFQIPLQSWKIPSYGEPMVAKLGLYKDNSIIICSGVESTKPSPSLPSTPVKRLSVQRTSTPNISPRGHSGLKSPPSSTKKLISKVLSQSIDSQDENDLDSFSEFEQPDAPTTPVTPDMMIYNLMESKYSHIFRVIEGDVGPPLPPLTNTNITADSIVARDWGIGGLCPPGPEGPVTRSTQCPRVRCVVAATNGQALVTGGSDLRLRAWPTPLENWGGNQPKQSNPVDGPSNWYPQYRGKVENGVTVIDEFEDRLSDKMNTRKNDGDSTLDPTPVHHKDTILDLKVLEWPQKMLISASRDGVIKVWK